MKPRNLVLGITLTAGGPLMIRVVNEGQAGSQTITVGRPGLFASDSSSSEDRETYHPMPRLLDTWG